jgi:hypothetical protein
MEKHHSYIMPCGLLLAALGFIRYHIGRRRLQGHRRLATVSDLRQVHPNGYRGKDHLFYRDIMPLGRPVFTRSRRFQLLKILTIMKTKFLNRLQVHPSRAPC